MLLQEMKYSDIEEYLKVKKAVIVPLGSTEQHGLHAPLGTDAITAFEIAKEVGKRTSTVVVPVLSYGFSPGLHCTFPGTISLSGKTMISILNDILESLTRAGFYDIMLLTGHGMNIGPLHTAVGDFLNYNDAHIIVTSYWDSQQFKALLEEGEGVHATPSETSIVMYLYPDLIDMNKAVNEQNYAPYFMGKSEIRRLSNTGVVANATISSAEKGKKFFESSVEGLIEKLSRFEENV